MKSNFEGKRYSSKQRKIHKLKRENVVLGQQRISYIKSFEMQGYMKDDGTFWVTKPFRHFYLEDVLYLNTLSFKLVKIQLRFSDYEH